MSLALALLSQLQVREAVAGPSREDILAMAQRSTLPMACGVYVLDTKSGWLVSTGRIESRAGHEVLVIEDEFVLRSTFEGEAMSMNSWSRSTYALDGRGEILEIEQRDEEDGLTVERTALLEDGKFVIRQRGAEYETRREVDPPRECLAESARFEAWLASAPEPGAQFEIFEVDLEAESIDSPTQIRYLEARRELVHGSLTPAHRLAYSLQGLELEATVLSDFRPISASMMGVIEFRLEELETVKDLAGPGAEFLDLSIPCDEQLGDPAQVRYLELDVSKSGEARIPVDRRQVLVQQGDVRRLRLWREPPEDVAVPLTDADVQRYTASTVALQSDHPKIRAQARAVAGSIGQKREAARALMTWVYETLEPSYARNAPTALDVLSRMAGDCTEHALVFTALARALGIPSRVVGGVMYCGDELGAFAWHAWVEIHDGARWITIDPTWNQMPVDATHIKLDEDGLDGDESWTQFVGQLELWVVDSERD